MRKGKAMIVTTKQLLAARACQREVRRLRRRYGKAVDVTEAWCVAHASDGLDWDWAAEHLLPPEAWEDYHRARAPAWEDYHRATAPAWEDYKRATAAAREDYDRAKAEAFGRIVEREP